MGDGLSAYLGKKGDDEGEKKAPFAKRRGSSGSDAKYAEIGKKFEELLKLCASVKDEDDDDGEEEE